MKSGACVAYFALQLVRMRNLRLSWHYWQNVWWKSSESTMKYHSSRQFYLTMMEHGFAFMIDLLIDRLIDWWLIDQLIDWWLIEQLFTHFRQISLEIMSNQIIIIKSSNQKCQVDLSASSMTASTPFFHCRIFSSLAWWRNQYAWAV